MKKAMRTLAVIFPLALFVFFYFYISNSNIAVLNPKGIIAIAEKNLLITTFLIMLIVVIPIFFMLGYFAYTYRAGNTKAKYMPDWHTNPWLELTWWLIPTAIIIVLGTITWTSSHELDPYKPITSDKEPIEIDVVALDWKWLFIYPKEHIATVNVLEIPKDTPIFFKITADAPMNAFWIPQLGSQVYAMPGMTAQLHLLATEQGNFEGVSSNFSGSGFSKMHFMTKVVIDRDYATWLKVVKGLPTSLTTDEYEDLSKQSIPDSPIFYGSVANNLYASIIRKYTGDMRGMEAPTSTHMIDGMNMGE